MTSFTSNSDGVFRWLVIFLCIVLVISTEIAFRFEYPVSENYAIRDEINQKNPDIILIGNSMAGNIDQKVFDEELSNYLGRRIKSFIIIRNSANPPVFYLIFKNQIATSSLKSIPVGIVSRKPYSYEITQEASQNVLYIKQSLIAGDKVFDNKYSDPCLLVLFKLKEVSYLLFYSPEQSSVILNYVISNVVFSPRIDLIKTSLSGRFNGIRSSVLTLAGERPTRGSVTRDIGDSFIPDLLNVSSNFTLFFVDSRSRPSISNQEGYFSVYNRSMSGIETYLESKNVYLIRTFDCLDLDNDSLYRDEFHLTAVGRSIEAKCLAKRLVDEGIIK